MADPALRGKLRDMLDFLRADSYVLLRRPELLFQQAANQPDDTAPARAAAGRLSSGLERRPWLRWVNKPRRRSPCVQVLKGHVKAVSACAVSPDGRRVASASEDGSVRVWDLATGRELAVLRAGDAAVDAVAFTSTGRLVCCSGSLLRVCDGETLAQLCEFQCHSEAHCLAFSPDGACAVSVASSDNKAQILDLAGVTPPKPLSGHFRRIWDLAFSPDGRRIATASEDGTLKIWDAKSGEEVVTLAGHGRPVLCCAFLPDGRVVSGARDHALKVWDLETASVVATLSGHAQAVGAVVVSSDGARIVSQLSPPVSETHFTVMVYATADTRSLTVWDLSTRAVIARLQHEGMINSMRLLPDGRLATASWDHVLRIWDLASGKETATLSGHSGSVRDCAFTPDGRLLVSASEDCSLCVWDTAADGGKVEPAEGCTFAAEGRRVLSHHRGRLWVWDSETGAGILSLTAELWAHSPFGDTLVTANDKGTLFFFNMMDGTPLGTCEGEGRLAMLTVSPNGSRLAAAGERAVLFDMVSREKVAVLDGERDFRSEVWFSPDSRRFSMKKQDNAFTDDGTEYIYDATTGAAIGTHRSLSTGGSAMGWRIDRGRVTDALTGTLWREHQDVLATSPDGRRLVRSGHKRALVVDAFTGSVLARFRAAGGYVDTWQFAPDGGHFDCGGEELTVWDLASGAKVLRYLGPSRWERLAWSPDGRRLAATGKSGGMHLLEPCNFALQPLLASCWVSSPGRRRAFRCPNCRAWREVLPQALGRVSLCGECGGLFALDRFVRLADWQSTVEICNPAKS